MRSGLLSARHRQVYTRRLNMLRHLFDHFSSPFQALVHWLLTVVGTPFLNGESQAVAAPHL